MFWRGDCRDGRVLRGQDGNGRFDNGKGAGEVMGRQRRVRVGRVGVG